RIVAPSMRSIDFPCGGLFATRRNPGGIGRNPGGRNILGSSRFRRLFGQFFFSHSKVRKIHPRVYLAAKAVAEALEQRALLTVSGVSVDVPPLNRTEGSALTFGLNATSDVGMSSENVAWGDGSSNWYTLIPTTASHTYAVPGSYAIVFTASDADNSVDASATADIGDVPLTTSNTNISAVLGQAW